MFIHVVAGDNPFPRALNDSPSRCLNFSFKYAPSPNKHPLEDKNIKEVPLLNSYIYLLVNC